MRIVIDAPRLLLNFGYQMHARQHKFTLADVAKAAEVSVAKVYRDVRDKKLDPTNLAKIARYIGEHNGSIWLADSKS